MKPEEYIRQALEQAIGKAGLEIEPHREIEVANSRQKEHGDLATNIALQLAKPLKKPPREIAQAIVDALDLNIAQVGKVTLAGPGFINFTLSQSHLHHALQEILDKDASYGRTNLAGGQSTQVEFVSANPTGPLTIGHGRQAVLGDTIARLLEAVGHNVTREYYFNDAGRQMRVLGESVRYRYLELLGESVDFPDDHYQGEYIRDIAQKAVDNKGDSLKEDPSVEYFTQIAEETIFEDIKSTLARMNIVHDVFYNEKSLYETGKIDAVIQALRDKNLAYDKDDAVWFKATECGLDQDRVIVKSTGEPTYRLPDIAYHRDKLARNFDLIIDIFGADHIATYPDVMAGLKALDCDPSKVKVLIHQFVTLTEGQEKIKMSTRKANFVTLDELMDEVGADVTRYFFLNRSMSSHLNFDLTLAKTESDENPVYYVQYAHARICSILRFAEKEGHDLNATADLTLLTTPEEINLIKALIQFPQVVSGAAENFEPHRLPTYLEELATIYHRFQHAGKRDTHLRVVTDDIEMTKARLALCQATKIVLANGLTMLGISKPEKM